MMHLTCTNMPVDKLEEALAVRGGVGLVVDGWVGACVRACVRPASPHPPTTHT